MYYNELAAFIALMELQKEASDEAGRRWEHYRQAGRGERRTAGRWRRKRGNAA